jgi:C4-dicarboxylate-specific signal transduction histidine kinase
VLAIPALISLVARMRPDLARLLASEHGLPEQYGFSPMIIRGQHQNRPPTAGNHMKLQNKVHELKLIAGAFQKIAKEISYEGLANALLTEALSYCRVARGGVLLSEGGALLAKADASFPRERARFFVSQPATAEFRVPDDLNERVLDRQETVVRDVSTEDSLLLKPAAPQSRYVSQLFVPLVHREWTIGVLYLEAEPEQGAFTSRCISGLSILASQAAVSFESVRLFEALRETNMWMVKGQEIGRMGSYRWNTRTLLSRASRECYRIFDLDFDMNPLPFEVFKSRIHPDDLSALEQALTQAVNTKSPFNHEYRIVRRDGTTLRVVAVGQFDHGPTGDIELEGIVADVTDRRNAEQALTDARNELARALRLASIGELAGSISHEVNQPLTNIVMSAEACIARLSQRPAELADARKFATGVIEQAYRAVDVIAGLRSLVRNARLQFASVDINEAVEEVLRLSKRDLERACVTLHTEFDRSLPDVEADRVQIQQVVLNLVRNAIEAMEGVEESSRALTVSSKAAEDYVSIAITDTGPGVTSANRERVFDALYTTKGAGLGLGLSICRKIVTAHEGRLWVEDGTMYGAAFKFVLPLNRSIRMSGNN